MSQNSAAGAKGELRQKLIERRNLLHISKNEIVDEGITSHLSELCRSRGVKTVAAYQSFGTEPSTLGFLNWTRLESIRVLLPVSLPDGQLEWVESTGEKSAKGIFGFDEAIGPLANLSEAELVLVPALAVDHRGIRLGKGKGYYDRALGEVPHLPSYAVIFESEVLDDIPFENHDVSVSGFVTESRIVTIAI